MLSAFYYKGENDIRECTVCYVEFEKKDVLILLPCMHYFHPKCIDSWLLRKGICPYCSFVLVENTTNQ